MRQLTFWLLMILMTGQVQIAFANQNSGANKAERSSEQSEGKVMNNARLGKVLGQFTDHLEGEPGYWEFQYEEFQVLVMTDERANRMRIIVPVAKADELSPELSYRLLQANFDTALDSRYAIAGGIVYSAYIHPLGELSEEQVVSALAQTLNLAATFGSTFSSGELVFRGGDSESMNREVYESVKRKGRRPQI